MNSYNFSGLAHVSIFLTGWDLDILKRFPKKHMKQSETTVLLQTIYLQYCKNYPQLTYSC